MAHWRSHHINAMTVLTAKQAEEILAKILPPTACDLCGYKLDERRIVDYGPFKVHLCPQCEWKWRKSKFKRRGDT